MRLFPAHLSTCVLLALTLVATAARAQGAAPTLQIPRVATPPTLEDYLEGATPPGLAVTEFRQHSPLDLAPASQATTAYLSYDDEQLYVAFVCRATSPADVRARMARRESTDADDQVGVYLDTFLDRQRSYVFLVNPLGVQTDGVNAEGSGDDYSFDAVWHTAGRRTSFGYVAWMAIPFKSLRFPAAVDRQRWGIALVRTIPANSELSYYPAISQNVNGFATQFATLEGLDRIRPGRNIQLIPYSTATSARLLDDPAPAYRREDEARVGLDAKFVVRDAVTVDLTANPDFSQVESDEPQVTVNQRFEVFFPEKRPFFLENADLFETPTTLFFSRRIRDPQLGSRVTGKAGAWAFGGLVMDDRAPGRQEPADSRFAGDRAVATLGRARFDFGGGSRVGVLGTSRRFGDRFNDVVSGDMRIRISSRWSIDAQAVGSRSTANDGVTGSGASTSLLLNRSGRAFSYFANYVDASPGFRTPLGFVPRVDMRSATSFASYRWRPTKGPVVAFGPNSYVNGVWSYAGHLQDWTVRAPFQLELKGRTSVFLRQAWISEEVEGVDLRQRETLLQFGSERVSAVNVFASYIFGTRPNYQPAGGEAPYLGRFADAYLSVTFRPMSSLRIDETYIYSHLGSRDGSPAAGSVFSDHIFRSKLNYQFSRAWSMRAILDYDTLDANARYVDLDTHRTLVADLLVTWLRTPGTAVYFGYTDGYENAALDPARGTVPGADLISKGRQVFVKASWLFRF